MQTPAPVDYARAHSVEEALELLERYGPESRLIAGGHSLIPMMRLRIAQPERVIDINDLTELDYIRVGRHERARHYLAIGAMTRHKSLLASAVIGEHYAILHDAEKRDRRPHRPQPRHHRRLAVPGRPGRRPVARSPPPCGPTWSCGPAAGSRIVPAREFTDGPYDTVLEDAEMLVEVRIPIRPGVGQRLREGGATRRRLGGRLGRRLPGARRRHASPTSGSGWPRSAPITAAPRTPRSTCAARTSPPRPSPRPAGSPPSAAVRAPINAARSSTRGTSPTNSPAGRCAAPPRRRRTQGRDLTCRCSITVNGVEHTDEVEPRTAARALPARHVAAHRNPLGLRHLAVRDVRGLAGRGAGEDLHGAGRDGRRAPGAHRRGPGGRRQARPGPGGLHERTRPAVRVLHPGHDDDRPAPARPQPRPGRSHYPASDLGSDLPVHRLREHRPRGPRAPPVIRRNPPARPPPIPPPTATAPSSPNPARRYRHERDLSSESWHVMPSPREERAR